MDKEGILNTHDVKINFGKHNGERFTRLPISYLKWLINAGCPMTKYAESELVRRGTIMHEIEISSHAINKASLRFFNKWLKEKGEEEGFYTWLHKLACDALKNGEKRGDKIVYNRMRFVFEYGTFPVLKSVM